MAYMSQERKSEIAPKVKSILKKFGIKGSLSVRHHSTLSLTLKSGKIDFIGNSNRVLKIFPDKISLGNRYHHKLQMLLKRRLDSF